MDLARWFLLAAFMLVYMAGSAVQDSKDWTRFRNLHACKIVPAKGAAPRYYLCAGTPCTTDTDCYEKFGR